MTSNKTRRGRPERSEQSGRGGLQDLRKTALRFDDPNRHRLLTRRHVARARRRSRFCFRHRTGRIRRRLQRIRQLLLQLGNAVRKAAKRAAGGQSDGVQFVVDVRLVIGKLRREVDQLTR